MARYLGIAAIALMLAACDDDGGGTTTDSGTDTGDDAVDVLPDPETDPGTDTVTDTGTDPGTDPGTDGSCVSVTGGVCHLVEQCGCSPGFYCEVFIQPDCSIIEDCAAGSGTLPVESECSTAGQCSPGMACLRYEGEETGHCYEWCRDASDCTVAGRECTVSVNFTDGASCTSVPSPYNACSIGCPEDAGCDLFATGGVTGCPDGQMCARDNPIASGGCDINMCIEAGTGELGEECSDSGIGCLPGSGCYGNPTDGYVCRAYCDDTHACETGTCTSLSSESYTDLGICI